MFDNATTETHGSNANDKNEDEHSFADSFSCFSYQFSLLRLWSLFGGSRRMIGCGINDRFFIP